MNFIRTLGDGKSQVIKDLAFCTLLKGHLPSSDKSFIELIFDFDQQVYRFDKTVTEIFPNVVDEIIFRAYPESH